MYGISRKARKQLIKAYKAYFEMVIKDQGGRLTLEERKAIGQKVLDDILQEAFSKLSIPQDEQEAFRDEFEDLIRKKVPESLLDTSLIFTGKGYQSKN